MYTESKLRYIVEISALYQSWLPYEDLPTYIMDIIFKLEDITERVFNVKQEKLKKKFVKRWLLKKGDLKIK